MKQHQPALSRLTRLLKKEKKKKEKNKNKILSSCSPPSSPASSLSSPSPSFKHKHLLQTNNFFSLLSDFFIRFISGSFSLLS
jgi:hypothetical protein